MDILTLSTNAKGKNKQASGKKSKQLIKREQFGMFEIITTQGKCFIALGQNRISEEVEEQYKKNLEDKITNRDWDLIMSVTAVITQQINKINK